MDSLTQLALGATIAATVLGSRIGPRKAVLVGAALGTAPDLDVLVPLSDPVSDFVSHRGPTHSLIAQALVTPVFGEALVRWLDGLKGQRARTYLAVFSVRHHALIDALTIYGPALLAGDARAICRRLDVHYRSALYVPALGDHDLGLGVQCLDRALCRGNNRGACAVGELSRLVHLATRLLAPARPWRS